jgi:hypothetical protein|tara:strand:- start:443 stop:1444 length:1002 start_codon:yes stop_codon:yes gene_type:complete
MAEDKKAPEVELDTDGVNEENVNIPEPKEPDEAFVQKDNVDLGYTDVTGGKTAKELLQETKQEESKPEPEDKPVESKQPEENKGDLEEYSEKVQKRIKKLTFQIREAERREKAAVDYAKGLKDKFETAEKKFEETDTNYLKEYDARIDAERDKAKNKLKLALDSNDTDAIMEANDQLTKLAVEKEKVSLSLNEKETRKKEAESQPEKPEETPPAPVSPRAQKWAEENDWFGTDRVLTGAAMSIHDDLIQQGIDGESDEYYNQINKRMKEYFPQKFAESSTEETTKAAPVQNVASVSRRSGGRKSVKLTKSQVVIAKKLGVPLEEYAKYVKEGV